MNRSVGPSAMMLVDEMLGTYIVHSGSLFRLCVEGSLYAPEDEMPGNGAFDLQNSTVTARDHVEQHLTRRLGADQNLWPLSARFFLFQEIALFQYSARADGTLVAVRGRGLPGGGEASYH